MSKFSILFPDKDQQFNKLSDSTIHDLGMDNVIMRLSNMENERTYITNVMRMMSPDSKLAKYRSDVFDDICRNPKMCEEIVELFDRINFLREYGSYKHEHDHDPNAWDLLHRLEEINDYILAIEALNKCLDKADIRSEGLGNLRKFVSELYSDNGFAELKKDISELRASTKNLKSITVGINLNERFEACGIGVVSINNKHFTKSKIVGHFIDKLSGKDNVQNGTEWNGDYKFDEFSVNSPLTANNDFVPPVFSPLALMSMRYVSEAEDTTRRITNYMEEVTGRMLSKTVKHLRDSLNKYTMLTITDITDLMPEFIYYIRWAEYVKKETARGFAFCKPEVQTSEADPESDSESMLAEGVFNLKLLDSAAVKTEDIVTNNLSFSDEQCLYVLTGANRGGKTTITQAIGQLFFMAQGGIYVTGTKFVYEPVDRISTHFPADEDKTLDLGRLGEECKRFRELYNESTGKSLLLLNETFSTTSFEEGYYIARDCIKAILDKGIRTIYNTHMHKLAMDVAEINSESGPHKVASLIVRSEEGKRSYEVVVAPPTGLSYASDIAKKYGVTYDLLTK